jgi:thiol-disulfide isomerase/thioredoxin
MTFETDGNFDPDFTFATTDRAGNEWNESVFANAEITMINFWEPWCSPCVSEMPDLEKLYENYKDQGFQIIGVYSETGMEYQVDEILKDCHTTYPVLLYTAEFDQFQTGYVPTTIFVDSKGHVLDIPGGDNAVIGSQSYQDWEAIVKKLLG